MTILYEYPNDYTTGYPSWGKFYPAGTKVEVNRVNDHFLGTVSGKSFLNVKAETFAECRSKLQAAIRNYEHIRCPW